MDMDEQARTPIEETRAATERQSGIGARRPPANDDRESVGQLLHAARTAITAVLEEKQVALREIADRAALAGIDVTLPARQVAVGSLHPLTLIRYQAIGILRRMEGQTQRLTREVLSHFERIINPKYMRGIKTQTIDEYIAKRSQERER